MNDQIRARIAESARAAAVDFSRDHDDPGTEILIDVDQLLDAIEPILDSAEPANRTAELSDEWGVRYPGWYQGEEDPVDFCDDQLDAELLAASQPDTPTIVVRRQVTPWLPADHADTEKS